WSAILIVVGFMPQLKEENDVYRRTRYYPLRPDYWLDFLSHHAPESSARRAGRPLYPALGHWRRSNHRAAQGLHAVRSVLAGPGDWLLRLPGSGRAVVR